jgi:hypothetical protein
MNDGWRMGKEEWKNQVTKGRTQGGKDIRRKIRWSGRK